MRKFILVPALEQNKYISSATMFNENEHNIRTDYINSDDNAMVNGLPLSDAAEPWPSTVTEQTTAAVAAAKPSAAVVPEPWPTTATRPTNATRGLTSRAHIINNTSSKNDDIVPEFINSVGLTSRAHIINNTSSKNDDIVPEFINSVGRTYRKRNINNTASKNDNVIVPEYNNAVAVTENPLVSLRRLVNDLAGTPKQLFATQRLFRVYTSARQLKFVGNSVQITDTVVLPFDHFVALLRYAASSRKNTTQPTYIGIFMQKLYNISNINSVLAKHLRIKEDKVSFVSKFTS